MCGLFPSWSPCDRFNILDCLLLFWLVASPRSVLGAETAVAKYGQEHGIVFLRDPQKQFAQSNNSLDYVFLFKANKPSHCTAAVVVISCTIVCLPGIIKPATPQSPTVYNGCSSMPRWYATTPSSAVVVLYLPLAFTKSPLFWYPTNFQRSIIAAMPVTPESLPLLLLLLWR